MKLIRVTRRDKSPGGIVITDDNLPGFIFLEKGENGMKNNKSKTSTGDSKEWMMIGGAACFEVIWVIGLKHAAAPWEWAVTAIAILISFYALIRASIRLPVGTVYAVFVGLGTAGTVLAGSLLFGEPLHPLKLLLIILLLAGVIGLKLVTPAQAANQQAKELN